MSETRFEQPRVTIGLPVYNAGSLLEECLENLAAQTLKNFKVLILDNASTDGTSERAQQFAARDARFVYQRQPRNVGGRQNFRDVLALADTPYFMWRAHDDLCDERFLEVLTGLLDAQPGAALAVGAVHSKKGAKVRLRRFPERSALEPGWLYSARLLFQSHPSWTYGLFRREALRKSFDSVCDRFPHLIASDHLTLFPFLITRSVAGSNDVEFVQRFRPALTDRLRDPLRDPKAMLSLRQAFVSYCAQALNEYCKSGVERVLLRPIVWLYGGRSYRTPKIISAWWRTFQGEKPLIDASGRYQDEPEKTAARLEREPHG